MKTLPRYFYTIKYLKFKQIYYRVYYWLVKPIISSYIENIAIRKISTPLHFILKQKIFFEANIATFLNHSVDIASSNIWNDRTKSGLWLYNLHYFDALNAEKDDQRKTTYRLLERWIDENPLCQGIGWQPFPTSLRIVSIIKYALSGNVLSEKIKKSLYLQARFLNRKCEYHLLGNHLFENFKALCFVGLFFETTESQKWFQKGWRGLKKEIAEQILPDGGHFELSPMYHGIFLEGLLDLQALFQAYQIEFIWHREIKNMLFWLCNMKRSDTEIAYFNDTANGIFSKPIELMNYANQLGYSTHFKNQSLCHLIDSGYIVIHKKNIKLILDVGKIGPDYLPGHGHADVLSFELYYDEMPVFVNLGTSCYGKSDRRLFERGTSAHNTVEINYANSSDVWHDFRVAKRAKIKKLSILEEPNKIMIQVAHDGYTRLKKDLLHERNFIIQDDSIEITDRFSRIPNSAFAYFHCYPDCQIVSPSQNKIILKLNNDRYITFETDRHLVVMKNKYAESFGKLISTNTFQMKLNRRENYYVIKF